MVVCLTHIPTYILMNIGMNINIPRGPMPQFFLAVYKMTREITAKEKLEYHFSSFLKLLCQFF